jgi:N-methylhydantoinase B
LQARDVLRVISGGGGGYGPARQRDPKRVLEDVIDGYVSLKNARKSYKVAIVRSGNQFKIDETATRKLRLLKKKRASRGV